VDTIGDDWAEQRRRAVASHGAALEAERAREAAQAQALIDDFVRRAGERGLPPRPLTVRALNGRATYRTSLTGWYLKSNRTIAVGADRRYYVLTAPASLAARLRGAHVEPADPRLVVGAGGGDGESVPLRDLLDRRLELGPDWP
jgi:hypothetical protein